MLILPGLSGHAQNKKTGASDSSVTFKVSGTCIHCKGRIETVVKGTGVRTANWDMDNKILSLTYNPAQTSLVKIENKIVEAGHDLEEKKAADKIYKKLPACCHYRETNTMTHVAAEETNNKRTDDTAALMAPLKPNHVVKGVVLESNKKGIFKPLPGASVIWQGTINGTTTDSTGVFSINEDGTSRNLVISYTGYQAETIRVSDMKELKIILGYNYQLG